MSEWSSKDLPTYEDWLSLSQDDKDEIHLHQWNVYQRDGIGFAYVAAGRLAIASETKVLDVKVVIYHGGEYILEAHVEPSILPSLPGWFEQTFEGFRVRYRGDEAMLAEELMSRELSCPQCLTSFREGLRGISRQDHGTTIVKCGTCPAILLYDADYSLIKEIQ